MRGGALPKHVAGILTSCRLEAYARRGYPLARMNLFREKRLTDYADCAG